MAVLLLGLAEATQFLVQEIIEGRINLAINAAINTVVGETKNKFRLLFSDETKVADIIAAQVKLLGSVQIYEKLDKNLRELKFDPYFAEEQFELYAWREDFFYRNFPNDSWFTNGNEDNHEMHTIPYQITQKFEQVVGLSCSILNIDGSVYFDNNDEISAKARAMYDESSWRYEDSFLDKGYLEQQSLRFSDAAHALVTVFQSSPLRLEHLAMKKVLEYGLPLTDLPRELESKSISGMYTLEDDVPDCLDEEGQDVYQMLQHNLKNEHLS